MNVHLYPYSVLRPWMANDAPDREILQVASAALLFDTVWLTGFRPPMTIKEMIRDLERILPEIENIRARLGERCIDEFLETGNVAGLTLRDAVTIYYVNFLGVNATFYETYAPLLSSGVIRFNSLSGTFGDVDNDTEEGLDVIDQFFEEHESDVARWIKTPGNLDRIVEVCKDHHGAFPSVAYRLLNKRAPAGAAKFFDVPFHSLEARAFFATAGMITLMGHSLCAASVNTPRVYLGEAAAEAAQTFEAFATDIVASANVHRALAQNIMATTLASIPLAIPRSPEALLALREKLSDELMGFREAIHSAAHDLNNRDLTDERLASEVALRFNLPLQALRRRLSRPGRDVLRNIVTGSALGTAITLAAMPMLGLPILATATLGFSIDLLTAALKTAIERDRRIEESSVAFLLRAEQRP